MRFLYSRWRDGSATDEQRLEQLLKLFNYLVLQTSGDVGYVVLDVDPLDGAPVLERLRGIPETIRVRELW